MRGIPPGAPKSPTPRESAVMGFLIIGGIRTQVGSSECEPGRAKHEISRQAHHVGADCISFAPTFLLKSHLSLILSLLLFHNRSRSFRLFACKRAHDGFGSLPTFCGDAGQCIFFVVPFQSECSYGHSDFYFSSFVMNIGTNNGTRISADLFSNHASFLIL